jgi:hypothetical protein
MKYLLEEVQKLAEKERIKVTIPINEQFETADVEPHFVRSYYWMPQQPDLVYHLHPELVHCHNGVPYTMLCHTCHQRVTSTKEDLPPNSIASGVDFGYWRRIPGLEKPNLHETAILALY